MVALDDVLPALPTDVQVPEYWMRRPRALPAAAVMNRFVWDLHAQPPRVECPTHGVRQVHDAGGDD